MKVLTWLLLLAVPLFLMADTNGAMMIGSGAVQINGEPGQHSSTIFSGDHIQTAANGNALIKSAQGVLSMRENSAIIYQGSAVDVERGTVVVDSYKGMNVHFENLTVSSDKPAKFMLVNANGAERVVALAGSIRITDGTHITSLKAGQALLRSETDAAGQGQAGGNAGTIGTGTINVGSNLPGWVSAIIAIAPAAAVGSVGVAGGFNKLIPVSNSVP